MKYTVNKAVIIDGEKYLPGDTVEITKKEATRINDTFPAPPGQSAMLEPAAGKVPVEDTVPDEGADE